jgi:hypothetical protein
VTHCSVCNNPLDINLIGPRENGSTNTSDVITQLAGTALIVMESPDGISRVARVNLDDPIPTRSTYGQWDYIYLDRPERRQFAQVAHEYLFN